MNQDTQESRIRQIPLDLGADLCGIAAVERFEDAPRDFHPATIFPECQSVVVLAKRLPRGAGMVNPRIVYNKANDMNTFEVDRIAYLTALKIESLDGAGAKQELCRPHTYGTNARGFSVVNCNTCRVVCPRRFGVAEWTT